MYSKKIQMSKLNDLDKALFRHDYLRVKYPNPKEFMEYLYSTSDDDLDKINQELGEAQTRFEKTFE